MDTIKKILHKYLCEDAIIVCELNEKAGDFVWLEAQGYYIRKTGKETKEGKVYTQEHDKLITKHFNNITDNSLSADNLSKIRNKLKEYIKHNPNIDMYKGLTEAEKFALRHVYTGHW